MKWKVVFILLFSFFGGWFALKNLSDRPNLAVQNLLLPFFSQLQRPEFYVQYVLPLFYKMQPFLYKLQSQIKSIYDSTHGTTTEEYFEGDSNEVTETLRDAIEIRRKNNVLSPDETQSALQILNSATFEQYREKWNTRFLTFERQQATVVVEDIGEEYKWNKDEVARLIRMVHHQLQDKKTSSEFKISKGINVYQLYYIIMHRKGEIVQMGIAHGEVRFKFNEQKFPQIETKQTIKKGGWFSNDVVTNEQKEIGVKVQERDLNFGEKDTLEKYFQNKALNKFIEEIPVSENDKFDDEL